MNDSTNTFFGWVLFAGVVALGLSAIFSRVFDIEPPEVEGYQIVAAEAGEAQAGPSLPTLLAAASVEAGETSFAKCMSCHSINAGGANGIGPNLHGIMGAPIAAKSGFSYSSALSAVEGNWTFEEMDSWLTSPRAYANGTSMSFAGLGNPEERADVLLYLNAQGSNLPLPEIEPAAQTEGGQAEGADAEAAEDGEDAGARDGADAAQDAADAGAAQEAA